MPIDAELIELLVRWEELREQGQDVPLRELCPGRPELAAELERRIKGLKTLAGAMDTVDGTPLPPVPQGFRMIRRLGGGSYGDVWLAEDLDLGRFVAMKTLKSRQNAVRRAQALEVLQHEARVLATVRHPNIVPVHGWERAEDAHYLVLHYVPGGSLADRLRQAGPLGWQEAAKSIADVGEGLVEVHDRGILHRDIKPANILWDSERDEALLADFGVSARLAEASAGMGTLPYMAPEALNGRLTAATDVYSLAATLFHLATGHRPFPGPDAADYLHQSARGLPVPDPRCRALPEALEQIIRAGLAADPARRPTLKGFVATLRGALNQLIADTLTMVLAPAVPPLPATGALSGATTVAPTPGATTVPPTASTAAELPARPAPVGLRLTVSREISPGRFQAVAATHRVPSPGRATRDMNKVPPPPGQVRLRTGERVRIEVVADRAGHLTVFNVGPTGTLNLLYPEGDPQHPSPTPPVQPNQPLHIVDIAMTPPTGRERLVAVWSREPLPLRPEDLPSLVGQGDQLVSRPYMATRDMKRVQESVRQLSAGDWHAVALELDHGP
jgi:tRNA A-37 threonylcarbamoyl transferase component Bud32